MKKPVKPHPSFPLYPHSNGQWAKKVKGRVRYFGPWSDPQAALAKWIEQKDDLIAGREPSPAGSLTVGYLVNHFLADCEQRVEAEELQPRTFADYDTVCQRVLKVLGFNSALLSLRPEDFRRLKNSFAKTHGAVALTGDITRVRRLFNYGSIRFKVRPDYGTSFAKPTATTLRRERSSRPKKMFTAPEIAAMLKKASPTMRAMIYLGINCAFGNDDCARLEQKHIKKDWHHLPRHKTGIERRCPLWPETIDAIKAVGLPFKTAKGNSWQGSHEDNPISKQMRKLMASLDMHETGRGFYSLRHTFFTIGKRHDLMAARFIMGHASGKEDMDAVYNETTFNDDLIAVVESVREWLFDLQENNIASRPGAAPGEPPDGALRLYAPGTPQVIRPRRAAGANSQPKHRKRSVGR